MNASAQASLILNVDDNDGARYAKTRILQVAGFKVIEAASGTDALAMVKSHMPDLVLLDVKLPDINGLEVCRRIKSEPASATVLVLQTSAALTGRADKIRGLEGGADNYLAAPIGADELVANVNALLRLRQTQADLRESEERFRQMAENINDVFWIFSLADREMLYVSPAYDAMWCAPRAELAGMPEAWLESIHAEDRDRVEGHFSQLFENQQYDEEYRIVLPQGNSRWVRDRAFPVKNNEGRVYRIARITSDISASKHAEKLLQDADTHKNEFLATLAHELRGPLGPIRNAVEMIQKTSPIENDENGYARNVISRQVDHMARLVDDLLDIARISQGKIALQQEPVDLNALIRAAVETSLPYITKREHGFDVRYSDRPICITGDAIRLAQAVSNLLNNAAKYTPKGGNISLSLIPHADKRVEIIVEDNGIGIPKERLATIFNLFAQGDAAPDLAQDGLGIGLSLVKQLVELHGGNVSVESAGRGMGSRFILTLPIASAASGTSAALVQEALQRQAANGGDRHAGVARTVLIVDDNVDSTETMAMLLEAYSHVTYTAHDAEAALALANRHAPEVILLDIGLPGTNGFELARLLRGDRKFAGTMLVAVTGYGSANDKEKALAAGFDHHLVKPADIEQILAILAS
ncbi:MAG TPA: response regulator [Herbaspirillum sp.]|jgi:PAS domain S-box-containing protein